MLLYAVTVPSRLHMINKYLLDKITKMNVVDVCVLHVGKKKTMMWSCLDGF